MSTSMDQQQVNAMGQVAIAERLLYASAEILALPQQDYEALLSDRVEENIFLTLSESSPAYVGEHNEVVEELWRAKPRLSDVLLEQWHSLVLSDRLRQAGEVVISNLNERGFHFFPLKTLANATITEELLVESASIIANFEPIGCATVDWVESLWVQSLHRPLHTTWRELDKVSFRQAMQFWQEGKWSWVKERLELESEEELRDYLRLFTPYPALAYDVRPVNYQQIDIKIFRNDEGKLEAELISQLGVERLSEAHYQAMLQQVQEPQAMAWLRRMWQEAGDLVSMHHYRSMQILRVVNYIITKQEEHLKSHFRPLQALQLNDIAKALQMSVSSVSRIIQKKYLWSEDGLIQCKDLLSRKQVHSGQIYSRKEIQAKIQFIIYQYHNQKISDNKIRRLLALEGIHLARRTINKYRHEK